MQRRHLLEHPRIAGLRARVLRRARAAGAVAPTCSRVSTTAARQSCAGRRYCCMVSDAMGKLGRMRDRSQLLFMCPSSKRFW